MSTLAKKLIKMLSEQTNAPLRQMLSEGKSLSTNMSVLLVMLKNKQGISMPGFSEEYHKIREIVEEHQLLMPEEEIELENALAEDGEAPTNVTAGIDATTPRIYTKQSKKVKPDEPLAVD
jgi:hypothetical protein